MATNIKSLAVTLGDSNGLGPELAARCLFRSKPEHRVIVIGKLEAMDRHLDSLGIQGDYKIIDSLGDVPGLESGIYGYQPEGVENLHLYPGKPTVDGGMAAGKTLDTALKAAMDKTIDAMVTGPLNKAMLQAAGFDFPGHTEFLADKSGVGRDSVCMHLGGPKLKVSLVTTHPALKDVPAMITEDRILNAVKLTCEFVKKLGLEQPVVVCGLNPHAGEAGKIGTEEIEVIEPALDKARGMGFDVAGPLPADTVFYKAYNGVYSAVLAMYHDQGLGPLKLAHFGSSANVTLGLPFIRTSVDHGTGYDLVGTGQADTGSFDYAFELALRLL